MFKEGFSLIELMVVIAIVAVLAAVALPAYQDYRISANVMGGMKAADHFRSLLIQSFEENGAFPGAGEGIVFNDVTVNHATTETIAVDSLDTVWFVTYNDRDAVAIDTRQYTSVTGTPNRIVLSARLVNGIWKKECGWWANADYSATHVSMDYLPSSCACKGVFTIASNDVAAAGTEHQDGGTIFGCNHTYE